MKNNFSKFLVIVLIALGTVFAAMPPVLAQGRLAMTITPPIIKNNVNPGQIWKSYLKVVNNNSQPIDTYVQLVNFESGDESGTVRLAPKSETEIEANPMLINNWIKIEKGPYHIPAGQSLDIPFIVDVPEQVDPGDHHIALLVGTEPEPKEKEGSSISIASKLGSLLLLNISGDVREQGIVRQFTSDKKFYDRGEVMFSLRFQNTGNTILQPQGEIRIYDFRDNDLGAVSVNQNTEAGNVFPEDTRRWDFAWPVPSGLLEMGRYKAELVLGYGTQVRENTSQVLYFWVIQWRPIAITLIILLLIVISTILLIRRSVRRAIMETQESLGVVRTNRKESARPASISDNGATVVDLKAPTSQRATRKRSLPPKKSQLFMPLLVLGISFLICILVFLFLYLTTKEKTVAPLRELSGQGILDNTLSEETEEELVLDSERQEEAEPLSDASEIDPLLASTTVATSTESLASTTLIIHNGNGQSGIADKAQRQALEAGFKVLRTDNAANFDYATTSIKFKAGLKTEAIRLADRLGVIAESQEVATIESDIEIILGKDFE
jgi:hypothetical protein